MGAMTLLAQAEGQAGPGALAQFFPMILLGFAAVFLLVLPARRQRKQQEEMLSGLKRNDEVLTQGGMIGIVVGVREAEGGRPAEITLKTEDGRIRMLKSAVVSVLSKSEAKTEG